MISLADNDGEPQKQRLRRRPTKFQYQQHELASKEATNARNSEHDRVLLRTAWDLWW